MSHRHTRNLQWGVFLRTVELMKLETNELLADVFVSLVIAFLAWEGGANPTFAVACISLVHSVHIPRAIRAYREAKHDYPLAKADE